MVKRKRKKHSSPDNIIKVLDKTNGKEKKNLRIMKILVKLQTPNPPPSPKFHALTTAKLGATKIAH